MKSLVASRPAKPQRRETSASRRSTNVSKGKQLDPQFLSAAKASKKKFGTLFKRLAKT